VFARRLRGEHIVGVAQSMGMSLSSLVKDKSAAGIAESTAIKTQVLQDVSNCFAADPHQLSIGQFDGSRCLLEWKTSSSRYPEEPAGLLALDSQLVCYSWMTGISEVAEIVFVRKRLVEVQYLRTTITEEQRQEFGQLVEDTIGRIQSAQFLPHSGVRFP
jgi:hypothetical protein